MLGSPLSATAVGGAFIPAVGSHSPGARAWAFARKLAAFAGPGYLVAVGYMDPGNWATDIAGGSKYGYALMPVICLSGFVAMFLQWLSLRLGIASGRDLAEICRDRYPPPVARMLWVSCEIAIVACDLAEVIVASRGWFTAAGSSEPSASCGPERHPPASVGLRRLRGLSDKGRHEKRQQHQKKCR